MHTRRHSKGHIVIIIDCRRHGNGSCSSINRVAAVKHGCWAQVVVNAHVIEILLVGFIALVTGAYGKRWHKLRNTFNGIALQCCKVSPYGINYKVVEHPAAAACCAGGIVKAELYMAVTCKAVKADGRRLCRISVAGPWSSGPVII